MSHFTLPDGKVLSFDKPVTGRDVALAIGPGLAKKAIAVKLDGTEVRDLDRLIERDANISIITASNDNPDALAVLRHSAAHVLAEAICSLYPKTRLAYGPSIEEGFFYDMQIRNAADEAVTLTDGDFAKVEAKMKEIVQANRPFTRTNYACDVGLARTLNDKYKTDNAERVQNHERRWRLLARRSNQRSVDARLWHLFCRRQRFEGASDAHRRSEKTRPS